VAYQREPMLAQDIATFTHEKPRGAEHVSPVTAEHRASMRGTLAGQDYVLVLHPVPDDIKQTMIINCDGHGEHGEMYSIAGGEYLSRYFEADWSQLRKCCQEGFTASGGVQRVKDIFAKCEAALRRELGGRFGGGSTATVVLIIDGTHLVTANVGDSPAMLAFDDGRPHLMLTESHSADSPEEYTRYCARCRRDRVEPAQFVYNRFNCGGGHRLPGPDSAYEPIPIFSLDDRQEATVILENAAYVGSLGYHGGIQSVRKHIVVNEAGETIGTQPDKAYLNWGSTVAGRPQNTRMLGDFEDKESLHLDAEPSVSLVTLDRSMGTTWLLVSSDGIADAHWFENLSSGLVRRSASGVTTAQSLCEAVVVDTIANAREANFNFKENLPAWDDLSLTLVCLPAQEDQGWEIEEERESSSISSGSRVNSSNSSRADSPYHDPRMEVDQPEEASPSGHGPFRKKGAKSNGRPVEVCATPAITVCS